MKSGLATACGKRGGTRWQVGRREDAGSRGRRDARLLWLAHHELPRAQHGRGENEDAPPDAYLPAVVRVPGITPHTHVNELALRSAPSGSA